MMQNDSTTSTRPGVIAGILGAWVYAIPAGAVLGGLSRNWHPDAFWQGGLVGAGAGLVLGLIFGRFERTASAVVAGGLVPLFLVLKDAIRRGHFDNARGIAELKDPQSLLIMAGIVLGGAAIAGLVHLTARGVRSLGGANRRRIAA